MILFIVFSSLFVYGTYLAYTEWFLSAPAAAIHAVASVKNFGYTKKYQILIEKISTYLLRFVTLPEYKETELNRMLFALDSKDNATQYVAKQMAQCMVYIAIGVVLYPLSSASLPLLSAFSFYHYRTEMKSIKKKYIERKEAIELELPKLCSVINSRLQSTSNTQVILQSFLPIAGKAMAHELRIAINDMKTGSPEMALRRLEQRINSPKVSDIIRGLISVQNGDNQAVYFQSKQYQFNNDYLTIKKKNISQRPLKLTLPGLLAAAFFFLIIMYPPFVGISAYMQNKF